VPDSETNQAMAILRAEVETLLTERQALLRATGAAAVFVAKLDSHALPESTYDAADILAGALNALPEETLRAAGESSSFAEPHPGSVPPWGSRLRRRTSIGHSDPPRPPDLVRASRKLPSAIRGELESYQAVRAGLAERN
jgi:hypothetical protein